MDIASSSSTTPPPNPLHDIVIKDKQWLYSGTHKLRRHEAFWSMSPHAKFTRQEMTAFRKRHEGGDDRWYQKHEHLHIAQGVKKRWVIAYGKAPSIAEAAHHMDAAIQNAVVTSGKSFAEAAAEVDTKALSTAKDIVMSGATPLEESHVLPSNFCCVGVDVSRTSPLTHRCVVVVQLVTCGTISIESTRSLCATLLQHQVDDVMMITRGSISSLSVLQKEFPQMYLEDWSCDDFLYDWFSHGAMFPVSVLRDPTTPESACPHATTEKAHCDQCVANFESAIAKPKRQTSMGSGDMPKTKSTALVKRLDLSPGDVIDMQRSCGRHFFQVAED